jgi:hypothetical protein
MAAAPPALTASSARALVSATSARFHAAFARACRA